MTALDPDPLSVPDDEPRPRPRPRPWGCLVALLLSLAFWAAFVLVVTR
jgi:hypothetical protein